ncbi:MAG: RNA polymerase sigma factor [Chitinophagales bacterium]
MSINPHNLLIEEIRSGNKKRLEQLYLKQGPLFVNWLKKNYQCSQEEAIEAYQESILIFCQNIMNGKLKKLTCKPHTYLFAIGKNVFLSKRRKYQLENISLSNEQDSIPDDTDLEVGIQLDEKQQRLARVIGQMGKVCRAILTAFYLHDKSLKEIAQALKYKNMDVIYTQKKRCLQKLRALVKGRYKREDF